MKSVGATASVLLALFAACGSLTFSRADDAPAPKTKHVVILSPEDIARLGIATAPAQRATFTPQVRGYGVVSSLTTVAQTDSDYRTALAAVTDSQAALDRAKKLYGGNGSDHNVSLQSLSTAEHQAASDKAQLDLADRKEIATFGQHAPWRGPPRDNTILDNLTSGNSVLVTATFPLGVFFAAAPAKVVVTHLNAQPNEKTWTSKLIWDAPADPTIPGRSFFVLVDRSELAQGEHVLVFAPTGPQIEGVRIPADAVILSEDQPWCYVSDGGHRFHRVLIDLRLQLSEGYFVAKGIAPNQPVVVKGTGLLLARELGAATPGQD